MSPNPGRKRFKIVLSFATFLSGSLSQAFSCSHRLKICDVRLLTHSVMCVRLGHFEPRGKHTKELRVLRVSVGWWEKLSRDTCYCLHWGIPHKLWLFTREIFVCVCVCVSVSQRGHADPTSATELMAIWTHWGGADAKWSLEIKMGWRRVVRDHLIVSDRKLFSWFNMHHNLKVHTLAAEWHGISGSGGRWTPVCCVCVCVWPGFPLSDKQCTIQLENKYNKNYKNMPLQLQIVTGRTFRGWISRSHPQEIKQLRESLNSSRILFEAACQVSTW